MTDDAVAAGPTPTPASRTSRRWIGFEDDSDAEGTVPENAANGERPDVLRQLQESEA